MSYKYRHYLYALLNCSELRHFGIYKSMHELVGLVVEIIFGYTASDVVVCLFLYDKFKINCISSRQTVNSVCVCVCLWFIYVYFFSICRFVWSWLGACGLQNSFRNKSRHKEATNISVGLLLTLLWAHGHVMCNSI